MLTRRRLVEQRHHVADVTQALLRILFETPLQQAARLRGDLRQVRLVPQDAGHRLLRRVGPIDGRARQHLVEHAAECPDVRALVDRLAPHLLGRHVRGRADDHARLRLVRRHRRRLVGRRCQRCSRLGEPEVEHLDEAVGADLHVARLEIAMHDAALVGVVERLCNLPGDAGCLVKRKRPLLMRSASVGPSTSSITR